MPSKRNLYIIGAGGFGRELENWLDLVPIAERDWAINGFLHQGPNNLNEFPSDYHVMGDWSDFEFALTDLCIIGVENYEWKRKIYQSLRGRVEMMTFIHPTVTINKFVTVGEGSVIAPNALLSTNVKIGKCVTVNTATQLGHDVSVGNFSSIMANVDAGGFAEFDEDVFVGSKATILPKKKIGYKATVGAGSVVIRNVKPETTVFGNPARRIARL